MKLCLDCEERGEQRAATEHLCDDSNPYRTWSCQDPECEEWVCSNCLSDRGEAAEQRSLSDFYGGSGPQTLDEQHQAAWKLKRGL